MLCQKQYAEIGLEAFKIMILMLKIKNAPKKFEDKELEAILHEDSYEAQAELAESLGVDHTTVSKCLKALGMIPMQGH